MGTPRPQNRRRPATAVDRVSVTFHVAADSVAVVDRLIDEGIYANRSHAVDAALKLLIAMNSDVLTERAA